MYSKWFYMLELALKNAPITLLNFDWPYLFLIYWTWTWEILTTRTTSLDYLIILNTGLGLINKSSRNVVTKVWRVSWIDCFLPFNIVLIHVAFAVPSFGNLCMMISSATWLLFMELLVLYFIVTYGISISRIFPHSLVQLMMFRGIVQIKPPSTSVGQILRGLKNQMLMWLSSIIKCFSYPEKVLQVQVWSNSI